MVEFLFKHDGIQKASHIGVLPSGCTNMKCDLCFISIHVCCVMFEGNPDHILSENLLPNILTTLQVTTSYFVILSCSVMFYFRWDISNRPQKPGYKQPLRYFKYIYICRGSTSICQSSDKPSSELINGSFTRSGIMQNVYFYLNHTDWNRKNHYIHDSNYLTDTRNSNRIVLWRRL